MQTDLWNHASNLYSRPGVEQSCLELQRAGANICLLLCAAWLGERGVAFDPKHLAQLRQIAEPWHDAVIQPLRQLRQQWRQDAQADHGLGRLRERLKELELHAERELLERLETLSRNWPGGRAQDLQQWLEQAMPQAARENHGALQTLRAVIMSN